MSKFPEKISGKSSQRCNSTMLLKWVLDDKYLEVEKFIQSRMTIQISVNVNLTDRSNLQCFHNFCQSQNKLIPEPEDVHFRKFSEID